MAVGDISRIANTTIPKFIYGAEDAMIRRQKIMAILRDRGKIELDHSGTVRNWRLEMQLVPLQAFTSGDVVTFAQSDRFRTATLDPRATTVGDQIDVLQMEMNKGEEAIVKLMESIVPGMTRSITQQWNRVAYQDGSLTSTSVHGFDSMTGLGTNSTNQPIVFPSGTYAGLSTVLGTAGGGSWEQVSSLSNWPDGVGDEQHDFFTPLIVNYQSNNSGTAGWSAATKTWPNTCVEALRYGIAFQSKNVADREDALDLIIMPTNLLRQYQNALDTKERAVITRGDGRSGLYRLGWGDTINFEGVDVTSEYGTPTNKAYGWSFGNTLLASWQDRLFKSLQKDWDPTTLAWRFVILFFGNFFFTTPRFFLKFVDNGN